MGIVDEDVARVRAATDVIAVVSEHVGLRRVGRRWVGLCPFHPEKTGSFSVNAEEGLYHCFGCQAGGDVITFVREIEHVDFAEAVERLASRAGIQLRYDQAVEGRERRRRERLLDAMEAAVAWYHERLLSSPDAAAARAYLRSRGYDRTTVAQFRLGWAPDEWHALARALRLPDDVLRDTGLGYVNRAGRQTDAFRARIMFPIFDAGGRAVAFGGRILPGGDGAKYKNSQETPIYAKRRTLYALNWAKADIVESGEVVVCEGYTDVIGFFRAGVPRAVAVCGTALGEEHLHTLRNFAKRVVLAFDADSAGHAAAERFYEWERRYGLDIAVAALPPGADPGDVARTDPGALRAAVEQALPFLAFRLERLFASADLRSPEARARTANAALRLVAEHPDVLVRDHYVMQVADRCRVDPDRLRAGVEAHEPSARPLGVVDEPRLAPVGPEVEALRLAVHRPEEVAGLVHEVLFGDELHRAAFRALASARTLHEAIERAEPAAAALLRRLAVEDTDAAGYDVVALLASEAGRRALQRLQAQARTAPERTGELATRTAWLKGILERLSPDQTPPIRTEAGTRLVAWLVESSEGEA